ncbi:MAG TPA: hypothetical protein VKB58_13530 [Terriglobales bacterium]|nr:hypothetical protein [Terriglobales bacterium]
MAGNRDPLPALARDEEKFRTRVVGYIAATLKSNLPPSVKVFVLMMLFLFVLLSFETGVLILNVIVSFHGTPVSFMHYFYVMSGEGMLGVFIGIPLVNRMTSLEQTQRLEASFAVIEDVKASRGRHKAHA